MGGGAHLWALPEARISSCSLGSSSTPESRLIRPLLTVLPSSRATQRAARTALLSIKPRGMMMVSVRRKGKLERVFALNREGHFLLSTSLSGGQVDWVPSAPRIWGWDPGSIAQSREDGQEGHRFPSACPICACVSRHFPEVPPPPLPSSSPDKLKAIKLNLDHHILSRGTFGCMGFIHSPGFWILPPCYLSNIHVAAKADLLPRRVVLVLTRPSPTDPLINLC